MSFRILIAEDEDIARKHLVHALKREGYEVVGAADGSEALARFQNEHFDVLITDIRMPGMNGMDLLEKVKEMYPSIEVMIITGYGSIDSAVDAMKKGAYEYITKPFNLDELIVKVKNIHERRDLRKENLALKLSFEMNKGVSFVARSETMTKILGIVQDISDSDCNVLICGETGSGRGLLAKMIHFTSARRNMPFLSLNCATRAGARLTAHLFGSEKGEGPAKVRQGLLEIADSGTLFLDEVSHMPDDAQSRLLGVIENGEFYRDGGAHPIRVNVRFIAAGGNVKDLVSRGGFSEELYYRLNVMEIFLPPLREHKEDIEPLSEFFLRKHAPDSNKSIEGFSKEAMEVLKGYSFPGNVRELENIIERAIIIEKTPLITPESLPRSIRLFQIETFQPDRIMTIDELTRDYAEKVLGLVEGDKVKAAELLGISELGLWRLLKEKKIP